MLSDLRLFERARRREVLKESKSNRRRVRRSTCRQALATVRWTPSGTLPGTRSRVAAVNPSLMSPSVVAPDNQHLRTSSHTRRASYASRSVWDGGKFRREYVCVQTECQSFCGAPQWRSARGIGVDRSHKPVTIRVCKHMASTSRSAVSYAPRRRWEPTRARRRARSDQPARRAASRQSGAIAATGSLSACTGLQPGGVSCRRRSSPKVSAVGG